MPKSRQPIHIVSKRRGKRQFPTHKRVFSGVNANAPSGLSTNLTNPSGMLWEPGRMIWKFPTPPVSLTFDGGAIVGTARLVLLFWGDFWQSASNPSVADIYQAVVDVLNSPYLSEVMQYGFRWLSLDPPHIVNKPGPPYPTFSSDDAKNMVRDLIDDDKFPEPDDDSGDGRIVYMVFAPQGSTYDDRTASGAHGEATDYDFPADIDHAWVGWEMRT
jgi:hypothetical protein